MGQSLESVLPVFAPLPGPIIEHLLLGKRRRSHQAIPPVLMSVLERETGYTQAEWDGLLQEVRVARQEVYRRMDPLVRRNALSTSWLLQALMEATPPGTDEGWAHKPLQTRETISQSTLKEWKDRGLIKYRGRNHPDVHHAAALLIARLIDQRVRNWLPTSMTPAEMRQWCWRQDASHLAPVPCPLPLPEDLPRTSLVMSPWAGYAWDPHWVSINRVGAARWAGVTGKDQQQRWALTLEELRLWDPQVAALHVPVADMEADLLHQLADLALIRLAYTQLRSQS